MSLIITTITPNGSLVSFSNDSLDAGNVKSFRDEIAKVTESSSMILLDMSQLSFVDSSGLGALLSCLRAMNSKDGSLRLFGITKPVMALFELVRMHRLFSIYSSQDDALNDTGVA